MTARRGFLSGLLVVTALLLQTVLVSRLALPYGDPNLVVIVVTAVACAAGPSVGAGAGFAAGLLLDLLGTAPLGLWALVLTLVGYAAGRLAARSRGSLWPALGVVACGSVAAPLGYGCLVWLAGAGRLDQHALTVTLPAEIAYGLLLAALVVPGVFALDRRFTRGVAR